MYFLYHYTSIDGFMGIFSKCTKNNPEITMRATHSMFLNDPSEYKLGRSICKESLLYVEDELKIPQKKRLSNSFFSSEEERYQETMDYIYSTMPHTIDWGLPYLFSLSENNDSLPMWTTYAKNGQGLALGFGRTELETYNNIKMGKCCYNVATDEEYMVRYNRIKNRWRELYANRSNIEKLGLSKLVCDASHLAFREECPYIKHHGYDYEREVRCIAVKDKDNNNEDIILYRNSNNLIIPYVERRFRVNCLKRIVIGPCADKEKIRTSLRMFLKDKIKNIKDFDIGYSNIPYRG